MSRAHHAETETTRLLPPPSDVTTYTTTSQIDPPPGISNEHDKSNIAWVLGGPFCAIFLAAMDGTIVATLATPIGNYFKQSQNASHLGTAYLLSVCCFTPIYGRLSDIIGRRDAILLAMSLFTSGTFLCGLSSSMTMLITSRAIAGMGGGAVTAVTNIILSDILTLRQRGLFQGVLNLMWGLGGALGGSLGGFVNDTVGWRWAFHLQVPFLILSMTIIYLKINIPLSSSLPSQSTREKLYQIDWLGSLTLITSIACFLLGISLKLSEDIPWSNPLVWGSLLTGAVSILLFVLVEMKSASPIMPLELLRDRSSIVLAIINFFFTMTVFGMLYNIPLYFSAVRLTTSAEAGLHLLPNSIALPIGSLLAGVVIRYTGHFYGLNLGATCISILSAGMISSWSKGTSMYHLWLDIIPNGLAVGCIYTTSVMAIMTCFPKEKIAVVTGFVYLFRTSGQALAVSIFGALIQYILTSELQRRITGPNSNEIILHIRHDTDYIRTLPPALKSAAVDSYAVALRVAFLCQTAAAVVMFLVSLGLREHSNGSGSPNPTEQSREDSQSVLENTEQGA